MRNIKKIVLLLIIMIALSIIFLYKKGYDSYYSIDQESLNEKINGTTYHDIVFIGSSRTFYQINPRIIDSVTEMKSFNPGIGGANLFEINMILDCYLKSRPAPKYIFMDIAWTSFYIKANPLFDPNIYYSFLDNEIIYNTLKPYKKVFLLKNLPFLQLMEADETIRQDAVLGLMGKKKEYKGYNYFKGYLPFGTDNDTLKLPFKPFFSGFTTPVTQRGIYYLERIIATCKKNNIKLFVIYPPVYKFQDKDITPDFFPTIEETCKKHQISFLNYRLNEIGQDHRLFKDEMHLNRKGSDIFSALFAKDILKSIGNYSYTFQENKK